jgi:hypothetical protein
MDPVILIDNALAGFVPAFWRIILWGAFSGAFSMGIYAWISPQQKLAVIKGEQKSIRSQLMRYDGEFDGLKKLIAGDLGKSLSQIKLLLIPFVVSVAPVMWIIYTLYDVFGNALYTSFGPEWMQGFEFWYVLTLVIVSLIIKFKFKII